MTKAVIYCRTSSDKQREEETIQDQVYKNKLSCQKNGSVVFKEYLDDGWSGATIKRPALTELFEDAQKGEFQEVYLTNLSRLSRDAIKQGVALEKLKRNDVKVFVDGKALEDTKEGKFLITTLGAAHELQKEMIIESTSAGRERSIRNGKLIMSTTPYGLRFKTDKRGQYIRDEKKGKIVELDPEESKVIRDIFNSYLSLQSPYFVAKKLNKKGLRTRRGAVWAHSYIREILKNKVYIGQWYYGKRQAAEPKKRKNKDFIKRLKTSSIFRDEREWTIFPVPAIIDEGTFYTAQEIFKRRARMIQPFQKKYLLSGFIYCGKCGSRMYGKRLFGYKRKNAIKAPEYFYYDCGNKTKLGENGKLKCYAKSVRIESADNAVWDKIVELFNNPKEVFKYAKLLNDKENNVNILTKQRDAIKSKIEAAKEGEQKVLELYENGEIDKDIVLFRLKQKSLVKKELEKQLKQIDISIQQSARKDFILKEAERLSGKIKERMKKFTFDEKVCFLNRFMDKIVYHEDTRELELEGAFPVIQNAANFLATDSEPLTYLLEGREEILFNTRIELPALA